MLENTKITYKETSNIQPTNNIYFMCGDKEMLRLEPSGDIYVKGKLVKNDVDVVEGLRHFLRSHKYCI